MELINWLLVLLYLVLALPGAGHALLFKRDPRSALGWITVCLMFPLAGPIFYFMLGINRIQTRARKLESDSPFRIRGGNHCGDYISAFQIPPPLDEISRMADAIVTRTLVCGNRIEPLCNGEAAYPAMLAAIEQAENYVFLSSYIFETNATGLAFIAALNRAKNRGVDVKVILDGFGELYSVPRAGTLLRKNGIRFARFLPPKLFPPTLRINLRNHRKILVTDGRVGFAGGMNIGDRHLAEKRDNPKRVADLHFRLTGPIVSQIEQVFLEDWRFTTREHLTPGPVCPVERDNTICRAIVDGPNVRIDRLDMLLICAVSSARREVLIMTPYFLPSPELVAAMHAAALRGVAVRVLLPEKNNLPVVHRATMNLLPDLLERGIEVRFQPPPLSTPSSLWWIVIMPTSDRPTSTPGASASISK
ncbi:cardiolipin synthase [Desulfonema ishimotonii]|uniref:Cardiolipin synthase n=1 Tax=Desulfonema ishimotonii TaxID=45657 RepID=A0A401G266_9BACT|nr:phospholipase D-like domain-containing protein [Desulfonema ishimotonii]GBC63332.1 cardiolipin synthase [Desulfonema ishimotonii]